MKKTYYKVNFNHADRTVSVKEIQLTKDEYETMRRYWALFTDRGSALYCALAWEQD